MHSPIIVIPSYNTGSQLLARTASEALATTNTPILIVVDGSTDGSEQGLLSLRERDPRLQIIVKPDNEGKGAAIRTGLQKAVQDGHTHALVMDADGQHPANSIDAFLEASRQHPDSMILGQPIFDKSVPKERLYGRKLSVWIVMLETLSKAIGDPLYGFRVYPIKPLLEVMGATPEHGRCNRYDFDPESAVRLHWNGVPAIKIPANVCYLSKEEGGVSHFHYLRDNLRFIALHTRLLCQAPLHWFRRKPRPHANLQPTRYAS